MWRWVLGLLSKVDLSGLGRWIKELAILTGGIRYGKQSAKVDQLQRELDASIDDARRFQKVNEAKRKNAALQRSSGGLDNRMRNAARRRGVTK